MMFLPKTIILHSFYVGSSPISDCEMPGSGRADVSPSQACGRSVSFSATNPENSRWTQFDRSDDQWVLYHPVAVWYAVENSGGLRGLQWVYTRLITFASFFVFASRPFSRVSFERSIQNWVKLSRSSGRLFQSCPLDQKSTLKASSELCWCPAIKTHYNILKHMKTFGHVWKHMKTYGTIASVKRCFVWTTDLRDADTEGLIPIRMGTSQMRELFESAKSGKVSGQPTGFYIYI